MAGGLGFAALLWVLRGPLVALDRAIADTVNALVALRSWLIEVLAAVTVLGATLTGAVVLATIAMALVLRGRSRLALYVAVTGLGGLVTPTR